MIQREILAWGKVECRRNTLCISRYSKRRTKAKDPLKRGEVFPKACQRKRERGESFSPRTDSHLAMSDGLL